MVQDPVQRATHWVRAEHDVVIGGRDVHKAEWLATRLGGNAKPASLRAAAEFGQVVLAALPFGAGASVAGELRAVLVGKVLIDCSNPVGPGFLLLTQSGLSAAQQLAAVAPGTPVVKAFNLCHEDVWRMSPPILSGRPLAVPVCGDDETALSLGGVVWILPGSRALAPRLAALSSVARAPPWRPPPPCDARHQTPLGSAARRRPLDSA
ncbi:NAD(P)-binding domain-containing protein [Streptomyces griseoloalbus]|uniref:NADPH-dependent F420 reductase n=1 Tax=Streptomyces griseoloalbus TaxID=67303 RepID=UPI0033BEA599